MVTFKIVQCNPGLTYIFYKVCMRNFISMPERQSARMSEIKNVG